MVPVGSIRPIVISGSEAGTHQKAINGQFSIDLECRITLQTKPFYPYLKTISHVQQLVTSMYPQKLQHTIIKVSS
jgi:hypothetical protein